MILVFSVLGGLGGAFLNSPALGAIAHYFNARRGFATGLATTAGGIGGIVFPLLLQALIPRIGFAWSTRIMGFILLGVLLPSNLFIRSRFPPKDVSAALRPDPTVFLSLRFTLLCLAIFFIEYGVLIPMTYIVSYAVSSGQEPTSSYSLLALLNAGSTAGRVIPGLVSDKVGRFNVLIISVGFCAVMVLGLWLPAGHSKASLTAFAVLLGFGSGSNVGLVPVCLGQLCDTRDYGRFLSMAMISASFGTLSSIPVGGALLGAGDRIGWISLILFSGVSYVLCLICCVSVRVLAVGWRLKAVF